MSIIKSIVTGKVSQLLIKLKKTKTSNKLNLIEKIDKINLLYADLSAQYQDAKISNNIPLKIIEYS